MDYYDPDGNPITFEEWAETFGSWGADRIVAQHTIGRRLFLSTVYLGLDHSFGGGVPLIYETMLFRMRKGTPDMGEDLLYHRYPNRHQANLGHNRLLLRYSWWYLRRVKEVKRTDGLPS